MSVLLRPRWLFLHAFVLAAATTCAGMSWWQFARAEGGNSRSLGYALQWPAFGLFALGVWCWLCRDAVRKDRAGPLAVPAPAPVVAAAPDRVDDDLVLPPVRTHRPPLQDDSDPELAAYNALLARLAQADAARTGSETG